MFNIVSYKHPKFSFKQNMNSYDKRQRHILNQIKEKGSVNVIELAEALNVSDMTIRRDLKELGKMGLLQRTHGGAVNSHGRGYEPPLAVRNTENIAEKKVLGSYAAQMILEGDSVALDVGSTIYQIAMNLENTRNITIVTPSMSIGMLFCNRSDVRLILPGGVVRVGEASMIGELARRNLELLLVDKLFLGIGAIDAATGLSEYNLDGAAIKQAMIKNAKEVIVVADASKMQKIAFAYVVGFNEIHHLVTDAIPPDELMEVLTRNKVKIHVVNATGAVVLN